ncbi:MAG: hypothetical protein HKN87_06055 [Saprospiraceae bacterium]|nr:hypothetical protein [Saprospiraceae bacterium]
MGTVKSILSFCLCCLLLTAKAQEEKPPNWTLNGYVKQLQTALKFDGLDAYLLDNLFHNRLNFRWYPTDQLNVRVEMRNRLFYGDLVKANPAYATQVELANNDFFDLSFHTINKNGWLLNSTIDRAYVQYVKGSFEASLGRQRINWGINTVWNPNDVFNAFAFTDFDYEERPGSDALRVKYYTGVASSVELAVKASKTWSDRVVAALYKWNIARYDFQALLGVANQELVFGGGWAGHLKTAGFKGEWSYFIPFNSDLSNSFALTLGIDYTFSNSLYLNLGYLFNDNGKTGGSLAELFNFELSAKNLYPFRHATFLSVGYPITPLLNAAMTWIYSPVSSQPLFLNPTFTYSVGQNWDLDLVGQLAFSDVQGKYKTAVIAGFLRLKLSF